MNGQRIKASDRDNHCGGGILHLLCNLSVYERQMMANRRKEESFKLDNSITYYLKDYVDDRDKQRKIIQRNNGDLFYIFKPAKEREDGRFVGEG
jgi:hypothetical protein